MNDVDVDLSNTASLNQVNNVQNYIMKKHNVKDIHAFLHPSLNMIEHDLHLSNKDQIHDMKKGCNLIKSAIKKQAKIIIYSDYDVDGITSNSIMYSLLTRLGAKHVTPYCPDRVKDSYGLKTKEAKWIVKDGYKLVITTDNGIASYKAVSYLKKHHVKVIISDHHNWQMNKDGSVKKTAIPKANAIIMPNCPFDTFHFSDFCGASIAFMIACYMLHRVATEYLDMACLGTVADSVALRDENRVIVYYGLKQIRQGKRVGIRDLMYSMEYLYLSNSYKYQNMNEASLKLTAKTKAMKKLHSLTASDLSYSLIPTLNSLGRLDNANLGRKLLLDK